MTRRWTHLALMVFVAAAVAGLGCRGADDGADASALLSAQEWASQLASAEVFTWDDQPLSFAPPPTDWERQREQSGGLLGARYVKYEAGGQSIHVAEVTAVGRRDRCSELAALQRGLDDLESREFRKRLQRARPYAMNPIQRFEPNVVDGANERLDAAQDAFRTGDREAAREQIADAIWDLRAVKYALDDVVGPALFTGEGYEEFGGVEISEPLEREVAGRRAVQLDYLVQPSDRPTLHGRQVHFEHNNRLFEAGFQGSEQYLPLFEAIVASITLPEGPCEH